MPIITRTFTQSCQSVIHEDQNDVLVHEIICAIVVGCTEDKTTAMKPDHNWHFPLRTFIGYLQKNSPR